MGRGPGRLARAQTEQAPAHGAHTHTRDLRRHSSGVCCSQLNLSLTFLVAFAGRRLSCMTHLGNGGGGRQAGWGERHGGWRGRQGGWCERPGGWRGGLGLLDSCIAGCLHSQEQQQLRSCLSVRICWAVLQTTHSSDGIRRLRLSGESMGGHDNYLSARSLAVGQQKSVVVVVVVGLVWLVRPHSLGGCVGNALRLSRGTGNALLCGGCGHCLSRR